MNQYATSNDTEEVSIFDEMPPPPVYYSERAVYIFTFLGGALFGAILMAMNLKRAPSRPAIWPVLLFGIAFTIAQYFAVSAVNDSAVSSTRLCLSLLGAICMRHFFWRRYIGKDELYEKRSVVVPTIILVVLLGVMLAAIFLPG